ncbi:MAG: DUF1080 domain-containing protein [Chitinophagaceae bacterium]|nr:DUF1080 domain-containing protein [Chitinophagaceae bacterium]
MRLLIPGILAMLAGCGQAPSNGEHTAATSDTVNAATTVTAPSGANELTTDEKNNGWKLLFDGKTKSGWHSYLNKGTLIGWKVEDGSLYLDSVADKNGHSIGDDPVSDGEYENFDLKIDWKISKGGNSGVMFGVKESKEFDNDYFTGPEMQVLDNKDAEDAVNPKHRAGDLYDLITSKPETVHPAGEWNSAEIYKNKDSLVLFLNGTAVVKTMLWDANWKKLVAGSKFKAWPSFGTYKSGHIALQDHGHHVWFKNIRIKTL